MRRLLLPLLLLLGSCALLDGATLAPSAPADSTARPAAPLWGAGRAKFKGPVTFNVTVQQGQGNTSTTTATAGKVKADAAAIGPAASATTRKGPPWWIYLLIASSGAAIWAYITRQKWH